MERLGVAYSAAPTERFEVKSGQKSFTQQYSHMYHSRLMALKGEVKIAARARWPSDHLSERIVSACEDENSEGGVVALVGTTFKEQARPDVLAEYRSDILHRDEADDSEVSSVPATREDEAIAIEDESGRVKLRGVPVSRLVTGLVIAVRGRFGASGELEVDDWCGPGLAAPRGPPSRPSKILLLSGPRNVGLLADWLAGALSADDDVATIARCFVAGNLVDESNLDDADLSLARLAGIVGTDALPGDADPTNLTLPQQPLHPVLLPRANRFSSFRAAPNPHEVDIDGALVLGHAGQPTHDMLHHADYAATLGDDRRMRDGATFRDRSGDADDKFLAALEDALWFRCIAPTAPDSLPCYPFTTADPFVIDTTPRVFFAGDAPAFAASLAVDLSGDPVARVVALPSFALTGTAALVDLDTLHVQKLQFPAVAS